MYVKLIEGVPTEYTLAQLRRDYKNVSFPADPSDALLAEYNVFPLTVEDMPSYDPATQKATLQDPTLVNGKYVKRWVVRALTSSEIAAQQEPFEPAILRHMNQVAQAKGYDSILSACSYAATANAYQTEGQAALDWRAAVWQAYYTILADIESGARERPSIETLISELPTINWG